MTTLTRHRLSAIWPDQTKTEFEALCRDIKANGVRLAITIYEGKVLDGWHRYKAALKVGITNIPIRRLKEDVDPGRFVCSMNAHRRHLNKAQVVAAIYRTISRHERPTDAVIAEMAQCSAAYVGQIRKHVAAGWGDAILEGSAAVAGLNEEVARAAGRPATKREMENRASRRKDESAAHYRRIVADYARRIVHLRKALLQCSCPCNAKTRAYLEEHEL